MKKDTEPIDPFTPNRNYTFTPERLSDNGTLESRLFLTLSQTRDAKYRSIQGTHDKT